MDKTKQEDNKKLEIFSKAPIPKAVLVNAIPAMVVQIMVLIYSMADTFFVGQVNNAYQLAAVSIAMPVFLVFMAVGSLFGVGGTSAISRFMGEGNYERTKQICSFCMWAGLIAGLVLTAIMLIETKPIVCLFLADADAIVYGVRFSRILLSTSALVGVLYVLIYAMQAMGAAKASFIVNLSRQGIIYIPLLFILQSMWGINGLVWAQPVADVVMLIVSGILLTKLVKEKSKEAV